MRVSRQKKKKNSLQIKNDNYNTTGVIIGPLPIQAFVSFIYFFDFSDQNVLLCNSTTECSFHNKKKNRERRISF